MYGFNKMGVTIASLVEPDPYVGGEDLVTCNTRSCSAGM